MTASSDAISFAQKGQRGRLSSVLVKSYGLASSSSSPAILSGSSALGVGGGGGPFLGGAGGPFLGGAGGGAFAGVTALAGSMGKTKPHSLHFTFLPMCSSETFTCFSHRGHAITNVVAM